MCDHPLGKSDVHSVGRTFSSQYVYLELKLFLSPLGWPYVLFAVCLLGTQVISQSTRLAVRSLCSMSTWNSSYFSVHSVGRTFSLQYVYLELKLFLSPLGWPYVLFAVCLLGTQVISHFGFITKTSPCNEDPLIPHFYIIKLGFTWVYIFFLFLLQNIDCGNSLEPPQ